MLLVNDATLHIIRNPCRKYGVISGLVSVVYATMIIGSKRLRQTEELVIGTQKNVFCVLR